MAVNHQSINGTTAIIQIKDYISVPTEVQ